MLFSFLLASTHTQHLCVDSTLTSCCCVSLSRPLYPPYSSRSERALNLMTLSLVVLGPFLDHLIYELLKQSDTHVAAILSTHSPLFEFERDNPPSLFSLNLQQVF